MPGGAVYSFLYSGGNLTEVDRPDGTTRTFTYDGNHRLLTDSDNGLTIITYTYDSTTGLPATMATSAGTTTYSPFFASPD